MKMENLIELKNLLSRSTTQIPLEDSQQYKQVTIRLWGKGVTLRNVVLGSEIKADKRYITTKGQFIISKIDARNGASGLIPEELDRAVVSSDFLLFNINHEKIAPEYLLHLSKTEWFIDKCKETSSGTTNRVRLNESKFLSIKIPLPPISEQKGLIDKMKMVQKLREKIDRQEKLANILEKKILDDFLFDYQAENN